MPPQHRHTMGSIEWVILLFLAIVWGGAFFFTSVALRELGPFTLVFGRAAIAAVVLYGVVRASGRHMPVDRRAWGAFVVMGLLNNAIPFAATFWSQTRISGGLASILNGTAPIWTVLIAHWFTHDEKLTPNRLAGVALGLVGLVVVVGPEAFRGLGGHVWAQLAAVAAAVSYALAGVYGKRFAGASPLVTTTGQVTCSALLMAPVAALVERPWTLPTPSPETWGALLALALVCTALAFLLYFRLLAAAGAGNTMLVGILIPITALVLGGVFLGETILPQAWAGMALIALGLVTMDGRVVRVLRQKGAATAADATPGE